MRHNKKRFSIVLTLLISLFIQVSVYANDAGFGVTPILPSNQIDSSSYFNLRVKPGQEQTLELKVTNTSNEPLQIELLLSYATTSPNGLILYTETEEGKKDPSLQHPLTSIVSIQDKIVTVQPNSEMIVPLLLTMPAEPFDGVILGGIQARKLNPEASSAQGVAIANEFAYVVGIAISETNVTISPQLLLTHLKPIFYDNSVAIQAALQNPKPIIMKRMHVKADFYTQGSSQILFTYENSDVDMAPNSNMDYLIKWEPEKMKSGDYTVVLTISKDEDSWQWSKDFTITKAEEELFANNPLKASEPNNAMYIIIIAALGACSLFLFFTIVSRKRKRGD